MLVFELHNLINAKLFEELDKKAIAGTIDRDHYSNECVDLEFQAGVQTQIVFRLHPISGVTPKTDTFYTSYMNGSNNIDDYMKMLNSADADAYDPRKYWGKRFDSLGDWGKQFDSLQSGPIGSWMAWWNLRN